MGFMLRRLALAILLVALVSAIALHSRHEVKASPAPKQPALAEPGSEQPPEATPDLPPPWESLQTSEPTLWKLASMGNRPAAERLFVETKQCLKARRLKEDFKGQTYDSWAAANQTYLQSMDSAKRAQTSEKVRANIALGDAYERLCGNIKDIHAEERFYPIAFAAARLGDDDATACILSGFYSPPKMTPDEAVAFDREAMDLGRRALANGHWNTVLALEMVYGYSGVEGQAGPVSHLNYVDYLKVLNLHWRGLPRGTPESSQLARQIEAVEGHVTPAEKFAAERWADETYAKSFSDSGPLLNGDSVGCDW
jgi:hypothetical protein